MRPNDDGLLHTPYSKLQTTSQRLILYNTGLRNRGGSGLRHLGSLEATHGILRRVPEIVWLDIRPAKYFVSLVGYPGNPDSS